MEMKGVTYNFSISYIKLLIFHVFFILYVLDFDNWLPTYHYFGNYFCYSYFEHVLHDFWSRHTPQVLDNIWKVLHENGKGKGTGKGTVMGMGTEKEEEKRKKEDREKKGEEREGRGRREGEERGERKSCI